MLKASRDVSRLFGLFRGLHHCEFCDDADAVGSANFGVPSGDVVFAAPELVVHYVGRHGYLPPA